MSKLNFKNEADFWRVVEREIGTTVPEQVRTLERVAEEAMGLYEFTPDVMEDDFRSFVRHIQELCRLPSGEHARKGRSTENDPARYYYTPTDSEQHVADALRTYIETAVRYRDDVEKFRERFKALRPTHDLLGQDDDPIAFLEQDELCKFLPFDKIEDFGVLIGTPCSIHLVGTPTLTQLMLGIATETEPDSKLRFSIQTSVQDGEQSRFCRITVEYEEWECLALRTDESRASSHIIRHPFAHHFTPNASFREQLQWGWSSAVLSSTGTSSDVPLTTFTPTVAGQALLIASGLAQDFGIDLRDGLELLLTGHLPDISPMQARYSTRTVYDENGKPEYLAHGPITLVIEPYVSAISVMKAYRAMQGQVYNGRDRRPPGSEKLAWFGFATDNRRNGDSWRTIFDNWIATGQKAIASHWRVAYRDYGVAKRSLFPMSFWATGMKFPKSKIYLEERLRRIAKGRVETSAELISGQKEPMVPQNQQRSRKSSK